MTRKQYFGGWLLVLILVALLCIVGKSCNGQSYIGKPYYSVVKDMQTKYKDKVAKYTEETASDGSKNVTVWFNTKQVTSYAFDFQKRCILYIAMMPDTSAHYGYTWHLNQNYTRTGPERWIEPRKNDTIVWLFVKSRDMKRSVILVYPLNIEPAIINLIESSR